MSLFHFYAKKIVYLIGIMINSVRNLVLFYSEGSLTSTANLQNGGSPPTLTAYSTYCQPPSHLGPIFTYILRMCHVTVTKDMRIYI
jgi:hypothetical protein